MAATARAARSSGPVISSISSGFRRSTTSSGGLTDSGVNSTRSSSPSSDSFTASSSYFLNHHRSRSASSNSVSFSVARQCRDSQIVRTQSNNGGNQQRRTCMCSPTTHPGSFRCSLHKNGGSQQSTSSPPSHRLNARRSAMTNSLLRVGTVEGDLVKRALAALIRPSSHQQRRRGSFQPRPSRLSVMSV